MRILALQSNRITKIEGLEDLNNLEELYLSHNGVQRIEGLEHNVRAAPTVELPSRPSKLMSFTVEGDDGRSR